MQPLLDAVRRRLWGVRLAAALRLALWVSTGCLLVVIIVRLAGRTVRVEALWVPTVLCAVAALAWAAWKRPSESACALWADRRLEGASAYSTLLELRDAPREASREQAMRGLEQWVAATLPRSLRLLAERRERSDLLRPLLLLSIVAALAGLTTALPDIAPPSREVAVPDAAQRSERASQDAAPVESGELASALGSALRASDSRAAPDAGMPGAVPAAGSGTRNAEAVQGRSGRSPAAQGSTAPVPGAPTGDATAAAPSIARTRSPAAGEGRAAGDSRDDRIDAGTSRALQGALSVRRRELPASSPVVERRADGDEAATFEDDRAGFSAPVASIDLRPPAATPPPAARSSRLSPAEAAYVQAWLKSHRENR